MTPVPGASAQHCVISDACRTARGDDGAFDAAVARLRSVWDKVAAGWPAGSGAKFHLVLSVERPPVASPGRGT